MKEGNITNNLTEVNRIYKELQVVPDLQWFDLMIFLTLRCTETIAIMNYMRYSTFYYKIAFMLVDFVQL